MTEKKEHFNEGNKHAAKPADKKAGDYIHQRVLPERKQRWQEQADKEGLSLSAWIQQHMDKVCDAADRAEKRRLKKEAGNV